MHYKVQGACAYCFCVGKKNKAEKKCFGITNTFLCQFSGYSMAGFQSFSIIQSNLAATQLDIVG